jgi:uncharacterized RDD family membrane protein YckC
VDPPSNGTVGSLLESAARAGFSGARGVAKRLGLDRAVDRSVDRALDSETAARATERLLDNDTTKRVWDKVLESDEAQKLVERVADAPEVRAAIAKQGIGLVEDLRRGVRSAARRVDTVVERVARGILRRPQREGRPIYAGAASRLLALAIDAAIVWGSLLIISAAIAFLISVFESGDEHAGITAIALGAFAWFLIAHTYLVVFWSGAGRTPGMSFVALRMLSDDADRVTPMQAIRRAIWMPISAIPLGLGFWESSSSRAARLARPPRPHGRLLRGHGARQGPGLDRFVEQLVRLGPAAVRHPQSDIGAAVFIGRVVRGDHGVHTRIGELLAPGAGCLQLPEVPYHVPVVVARVADVQLVETVEMK